MLPHHYRIKGPEGRKFARFGKVDRHFASIGQMYPTQEQLHDEREAILRPMVTDRHHRMPKH